MSEGTLLQAGLLSRDTASKSCRRNIELSKLSPGSTLNLSLTKIVLTTFFFFLRAQIDEIQKKQDKLNALKNSKLGPTTSVNNSKEAYGESPTKRSLPGVKSSRSSSFNRIQLKRLTAVKIFVFFLFLNKSFLS